MKKFLILFLLPLVLGASASQEPKPLLVGTTSGYAPFVSLNEKGQYEGFDIDVAEAVAKKLKRPLVIKDFGSMPGLMLALKQGKVDALIWAISITPDRLKSMEMIHYQGAERSEMMILFWKEVPPDILSFADLGKDTKKMVSVEAGSYQESVLLRYPQIRLTQLDRISEAILALKYGKAFALCIDDPLYPRLKEKYPDLAKLVLPLSSEETSLGNGICIDRSKKELVEQIRQAIDELKKDGTIAELEKKWGLEP